MGHLPLWVIEKYYPNEFEVIQNSWSCAIVRDPEERFRSALAQRMRQFLGEDLVSIGEVRVKECIHDVLRHLEAYPDLPQAEFCHFTRQVDFVDLGGVPVVNSIFKLEQLSDLVSELNRRTGGAGEIAHLNATEFNSAGTLGVVARASWKATNSFLPVWARSELRKRVRPLVMKSVTKGDDFHIMDEEVSEFVRDYYAADFALFASLRSGVDRLL